MINRLGRYAHRRLLELRVRPWQAFQAELSVTVTATALEQAKRQLQPAYETYIREVSRADMAASLELSAFVLVWCRAQQPRTLLDMGSGFSSFVLRLYAAERPGTVACSVDDDAQWLERSRNFVAAHNLNTGHMITLAEFKTTTKKFDVVLHDLNFVEERIRHIDLVLRMTEKGGMTIFDDVHKPDYRVALLEILKNRGARVYSLKPVTLDSYERYAYAAVT